MQLPRRAVARGGQRLANQQFKNPVAHKRQDMGGMMFRVLHDFILHFYLFQSRAALRIAQKYNTRTVCLKALME